MISKILQKYIPSKTYVSYLNEIGHTFTDFETASILYHTIPYVQEKFDVLSQLAKQTDDEILKQQIEEKVKHEKEKIKRFETARDDVGLNVGSETILIVTVRDILYNLFRHEQIRGWLLSDVCTMRSL